MLVCEVETITFWGMSGDMIVKQYDPQLVRELEKMYNYEWEHIEDTIEGYPEFKDNPVGKYDEDQSTYIWWRTIPRSWN